jgi:hypothetical protein
MKISGCRYESGSVSEECAYPRLAVFDGVVVPLHLADFLPMYAILALCLSWASAYN